ncbi:MAG TPA: helix-turn-helix domain-containing protein [Euzebyales bacterium]|nr:helix-turn-helix domain-containing protein [Euzebyales bacterium]
MPTDPSDTDLHRLLADRSRARLLRLLREDGPSDVQHLTAATGLHATTVRFHLTRLAGAGLVASAPQARTGRGRPRIIYTAVDLEPDAGGYRALAEALIDGVAATRDGGRLAVEGGRAWARRQTGRPGGDDARSQSIDVMDRLGFAPERVDDTTVALASCPLLDAATRHPEVVCSAHLGMLRGTLEGLGAPLTVTSLRPFAEPGRCVVTLSGHPTDAA